MYSKTEVCFTVILALTISWQLNSKQGTTHVAVQGSVVTVADGGHPPPPLPPPQYKNNTEVLRADGGHPPPPRPPQYNETEALVVDGGHPPPPPWLSNASQVS